VSFYALALPPDLCFPENGDKNVILAGSTCLAGDVFGEYALQAETKIGDTVVFRNVGAYSLVKANRFNGHALPNIYWLDGTDFSN